jgi:hypothetical protein
MVACGALVLALGLQIILPYREAAPETDGLAIRHPRPIVIPPLPESPAILQAPIFAPDRRPGEAGALTSAGGGSLAGYAALGAASGHGVGTAVISGPGGAVKTLRLGDQIDGWRLAIVSASRLTFERKGAHHVLVVGEPAEAVSQAAAPAPVEAQ